MRRVIIESPYGSDVEAVVEANKVYAREALRHSLEHGEAPLASHLLYTQVLADSVLKERTLGILAGLVWAEVAEATVVYADLGISPGMQHGIDHARKLNLPVEYRYLYKENVVNLTSQKGSQE